MSRARLASPHGLRCEYRIGPVGIDLPRPRLQWRLPVASGGEGFEAEVQLALSEARLLAGSRWESGCRPCVDPWLDYDGPPLVSATRYFWRVRLRSSNGADGDWSTVSRFTTGVLDPKEWRASWITSERWESYLQVKTVMTPEIEEV
ncbi:MAG TPA: hypothetical protein VMV68_08260, partial [Spirochaetia bacterium]|nr:hypothetical protein [Spirochaetia bacterium]